MRTIDAEAYAEQIRKKQVACMPLIKTAKDKTEKDYWNGILTTFIEARLTLDSIPTLDAAIISHGHWIVDANGKMFCSKCNTPSAMSRNFPNAQYRSKYCPKCGAQMSEDVEYGTK